MWALAWTAAQAQTSDVAEPCVTAAGLVNELYLYPEQIQPRALFVAAGRELEDQLPWLLVEQRPDGLALHHGAEPAFATLPWPTMSTLPEALVELGLQIDLSGFGLGDTDPGRAALAGMVEALDPHSRVLMDERLDRFNVRLSGTLVGIGATFDLREEQVVVAAVGADGPAAGAGLRAGDVLSRIDGHSVRGMPLSEVSRRVRGDAGTRVTLQVLRDGEALELSPVRAEIVVPNVVPKTLDGGVAYVAIDHVSQKTVENLQSALATLDRAAVARGLVIDLRGNTGGSMKESARLADLFVPAGELLRTEGRGGFPVENLQAHMVARDDDTEPTGPIVILVDERTASGAEILAGALLELDRAVLVGRRTYGKGTVQKVYDLAPDIRLKLTVARYVLAHGRVLTNGGLVPDVTIGRWYDHGSHLETLTPDESVLGVDAAEVLWQVRSGTDLPLEVARRTLLAMASRPATRGTTLPVMRQVANVLRAEEDVALAGVLTGMNADWTPPPTPPLAAPSVRVELQAEPVDADTWSLRATVTNPGTEDLHQLMIELRADAARWWDGVYVPVGLLPAGGVLERSLTVDVDPDVWPRIDEVKLQARSAGHAAVPLPAVWLPSAGPDAPALRVVARLLPEPTGVVGPGGGPVRTVEFTVQNLARTELTGLEVHLGYPETEGVELVDWGQRAPVLAPRGEQVFRLATEVATTVTTVPLELTVTAEGHGDLVRWPVTVADTGAPVALQAPRIERPSTPARVPAGPWSTPLTAVDDGSVRHVVVWLDGRKVAFVEGTGSSLVVAPTLELSAGPHRITVMAVDDQGLSTRRTLWVVAEGPSTVDAG